MAVNSSGRKVISLACLLGGIALMVIALILDAMKSDAPFRGAFLVIGMIAILAGLFRFK